MDESQFFSKPTLPSNLPPKRKPAVGEDVDSDSVKSYRQPQIKEEAAEQDNFLSEENEIDSELLAIFEQAVKDVGTEAIVDITVQSKESAVTAPVLADYIDPHSVPLQYLLEQVRAPIEPDEVTQDRLNPVQDQ